MVISSSTSSNLRPMNRLIEKTVFCGFVTCCRRAGAPTRRWASFVKARTDGVVRPPSAFGITVGSPPSRTAMHELVVPRSIPIVFAISAVSPFLRKSEWSYSRSGAASGLAKAPDQGPACDHEHGPEDKPAPDQLRVPEQNRGEQDAPQ